MKLIKLINQEKGINKMGSIKNKILFGILIFLFIFIIVLSAAYYTTLKNQQRNVNWAVEKKFNENYKIYNAMLKYQEEALHTAIITFTQDEKQKDLFLNGDRQELYSASIPLFNELNKDFALTHFYYMGLNRSIFLRVHQKDRFDDICQRVTCKEAQETKNLSAGIEFGPLMYFTLRVVQPYYDDNNLIGYVELGKEIEELGKEFKEVTGDDISLLVNKENIKEEDWAIAMNNRKVENNWKEIRDYVLVGTSHVELEDIYNRDYLDSCLDSDRLNLVEEKGILVGKMNQEGKEMVCSVFPLYDASGKKVGVISFEDDVTEILKENSDVLSNMMSVLLLLFSLILILTFYFYFYSKKNITTPLTDLKEIAEDISSGNIDVKISEKMKKRKDEIGEVAIAFDKLIRNSQASFGSLIGDKVRSRSTGKK